MITHEISSRLVIRVLPLNISGYLSSFLFAFASEEIECRNCHCLLMVHAGFDFVDFHLYYVLPKFSLGPHGALVKMFLIEAAKIGSWIMIEYICVCVCVEGLVVYLTQQALSCEVFAQGIPFSICVCNDIFSWKIIVCVQSNSKLTMCFCIVEDEPGRLYH